MKPQTFEHSSTFPLPSDELFAWHEQPGALKRLLPPWQKISVSHHEPGVRAGARVTIKMSVLGIPVEWQAVHGDYEQGKYFCDSQASGPFAYWKHEHIFESLGKNTRLTDRIHFVPPLGRLGHPLNSCFSRSEISRALQFRHQRLANDIVIQAINKQHATLRILVSGSSGLVGSEICSFLTSAGHDVWRLVRSTKTDAINEITWDPARNLLDQNLLEGFDAAIHLGGEPILGRWTSAKKRRIKESRVISTSLLCETLAKLSSPPSVLLCASAIGAYAQSTPDLLTEDAEYGNGFLAEVAQKWEKACLPAQKVGIRTAHLRFGIVLSPGGGALKSMLPAFRMGVGGKLGSGRQMMSWISIDDVVGALYKTLLDQSLEGPINFVSPEPISNREFSQTLARVLKRPCLFPVPESAISLFLGEMGSALLLSSQAVSPAALSSSGYSFLHPELEPALRFMLGKQVKERPSTDPK